MFTSSGCLKLYCIVTVTNAEHFPEVVVVPSTIKLSICPIINIKNLYEGPFRLTWKNGGSYSWVFAVG